MGWLTLGVATAIAAALAWAIFDALRKKVAETMSAAPSVFWLSLGGGLALALYWLLQGGSIHAIDYLWFGTLNLILQTLANFFFLRSVELSPLSVTIPYLSLTPIMVALIAWFTLGESLTTLKILGIIMCAVGALYVHGERNIARGLKKYPGAIYMCLVAILWSISLPLDKRCLQYADATAHATIQTGGVALPLGLLMLKTQRWGKLERAQLKTPWLYVAMLAAGLPFVLQLAALDLNVATGIVEAIKRGIGPIFALTVGKLFFGEKIRGIQLVAISLLVAGVAIVLLG